MPSTSRRTPTPPKTDGDVRKQFLESLDKLIACVQDSEPGFEFDHVGPLLKTLNDTACQMGYRMFGGISTGPYGDTIGGTQHHRVFMLNHPIDGDTFVIPTYTFDGPPMPSPWELTDTDLCPAERAIAAEEYRKLKNNEVTRHITTPQERGRILTCLREWRQVVGGDTPEAKEFSHSADFTSVNWGGTHYTFTKGNQAKTVRVLWEAWADGGHSLAQETIGERIESGNERFELAKVFRRRRSRPDNGYEPHPAWGTMIQQSTKGSYQLVRPESA